MVYRTEKYQKLKAEVERQSKRCKYVQYGLNAHNVVISVCVKYSGLFYSILCLYYLAMLASEV